MRLDKTTLSLERYRKLIDALLALDALKEPAGREFVLGKIQGAAWVHKVNRSSTDFQDVVAIWDTASAHNGLVELLAAIEFFETNSSLAFQTLRALIRDLSALINTNEATPANIIIVQALGGTDVSINMNSVTLVSGPYPSDVGPRTYVHGISRGPLVTAEDAAALVARLGVKPPLAKLTRPDSTPVWVKGSAVTLIRPPLATELPVKAVLNIGDLHQAVQEDVETVRRLLSAMGAHV
jgi:hypothetical protein